jgi:hypothetical protein
MRMGSKKLFMSLLLINIPILIISKTMLIALSLTLQIRGSLYLLILMRVTMELAPKRLLMSLLRINIPILIISQKISSGGGCIQSAVTDYPSL